jgi:hypothetical protein
MTYNPKIKNISKDEIQVTAKISATNVALGEPEPAPDGRYTDGLFPFTTSDNVGTAIDKINEVLAALAPKQAPVLETLTAQQPSGQGQTEYLALKASRDTLISALGDPNNNQELGVGLGFIDSKQLFQKISKGGSDEFIRLGVIPYKQNITFILNGTVEQNMQGEQVNYPDNAYDSTTTPQIGEIEVWMNGSKLTYDLNSPQTTEYTIEKIKENDPGRFASGTTFDSFKHSVTKITIKNNISSWREGHNFVQIKYGQSQTSYVDWVLATKEADITSDNTGYTDNIGTINLKITQIAETGQNIKYISGIKYITQLEVGLDSSVTNKFGNYAIQTYPENYGVSITQATEGLNTKQAGSLELSSNNVDINAETIDVSGVKTQGKANSRIVNIKPSITLKCENEHKKASIDITKQTSEYVFFDNIGDTSQETILASGMFEDFNGESQRVTSVNNSNRTNTTWDSTQSLPQDQALVFDGKLQHSKRLARDIVEYNPDNYPEQDFTLPISTGRDSKELYYRKFKYTSDISKMKLRITCSYNLAFSAVNGNGWSIEFLDGQGTWKDVAIPGSQGGIATGTPLIDTSGVSREFEFTFPALNDVSTSLLGTQTHYFRISTPNTDIDIHNYIESIEVVNIG